MNENEQPANGNVVPKKRAVNKWALGLLGLSAAAIVGVSASTVYAQSATPTPDKAPPIVGQRGLNGFKSENNSAYLAEALGISEEELQAAVTSVRNAAIDQALAGGEITQEQADALKAQEGGRGMRWGAFGKGGDQEAALAQALGITEEELHAAKATVNERVLAEQVAAGEITQEEAATITARKALADYLREPMENAYRAAVAQAVTAGVITQAQADQFLSEENGDFFGPGMGGGRMQHGHGGHLDGGPMGGGRGAGNAPEQAPNDSPLPPAGDTQDE